MEEATANASLQRLQCNDGAKYRPQLAVAEKLSVESGGVFGAGVEHVERLEQHEGGESQRQRIGLAAVGTVSQSAPTHEWRGRAPQKSAIQLSGLA